MSSSTLPEYPNVSVLRELLAAEKEESRMWLRAEMGRLVDPMLDSMFNRLEIKLTHRLERRQLGDAGDCAQVVNPISSHHFESPNLRMHHYESSISQRSTATAFYSPLDYPTLSHPNQHFVNTDSSNQQPNGPLHFDPISHQPATIQPFVHSTSSTNSQNNFESLTAQLNSEGINAPPMPADLAHCDAPSVSHVDSISDQQLSQPMPIEEFEQTNSSEQVQSLSNATDSNEQSSHNLANRDDRVESGESEANDETVSASNAPPMSSNLVASLPPPNAQVELGSNSNQELYRSAESRMFVGIKVEVETTRNEPSNATDSNEQLNNQSVEDHSEEYDDECVDGVNDDVKIEIKEEYDEDEHDDDCECDRSLMKMQIKQELSDDDSTRQQDIEQSAVKREHTDEIQSNQVDKQIYQQGEDDNTNKEESARAAKRSRMDTPNEVINQDRHNAGEGTSGLAATGQAAQLNTEGAQEKQLIVHRLRCLQAVCPDTFPEAQLNRHMLEKHSIGPNRCLVKDCAQSFDNHIYLGQHIREVHSDITEWPCHKCAKRYTTYQSLYTHNVNYHQIGYFQCSFASCTFEGDCRAIVHNHYNNNHKRFKCERCPFEVLSHSKLKIHERIHSGIKPYRCTWPDCDYAGSRRSDLVIHIRLTHFKLPRHMKEQNRLNITDDRNPNDFIQVDNQLLARRLQ